ncbi:MULTISPECIES: IclR family transcriptional regulator [Paraburkholderia]|uniref:IclR family transcriptional regulator n=1 Tax=Paraburkholderia metrosideri TaxID=580937 RepID=A0ABW9E2A1_9BURK
MNNIRDPLGRALEALSWLVETPQDEVGVRDISLALDIAPSSAHRVLSSLVDKGFIEQDPGSGLYSLGADFFRIAQLATERLPFKRVALPHLRRLAEVSNETVILGLYNKGRQEMMFVICLDSSNSLRYVVETNKWLPVHAGATGLGILAFLSTEERRSIISKSRLRSLTEKTITSAVQLEAEAERIRQRGYAISAGQRIPGAIGLAAPVWGPGTEVIGDVCLTIPEQRFIPSSEKVLANAVMVCAACISRDLGHVSNEPDQSLPVKGAGEKVSTLTSLSKKKRTV